MPTWCLWSVTQLDKGETMFVLIHTLMTPRTTRTERLWILRHEPGDMGFTSAKHSRSKYEESREIEVY